MELLDELRNIGVDVDEGIERLMGNTSLYERMLFKFADMMKNISVSPDFDDSNYSEITEAAHAVKGSAGNLSITPIYEAYTEIVSLLRAGRTEQAKEIIKGIQPVQADIIACIERYM
ncbi:MAG: Hpt domain-containing protein [Lachnospiraceae bacterium]|nr:Hpt domain-containing protein [Lachnospiraceae bacterium]